MKYILSLVLAFFVCGSISAQTFVNSQADWDALVAADPVIAAAPVFVQPGVSVVHNGDITFNTELQILGNLDIATGNFTHNQLLLVNQSGTLTVNSQLTVNGFPAVLNDMSSFTNNGISTFNDASGLTVNTTGDVTNNGTLTTMQIAANGGGTIVNGPLGTMTSMGTILLSNGTTLINDFTLNAQNGVFAGNGTYINNGTTNAPNGLVIDGVAFTNNLQLNVMGAGGGSIVNGGSLLNTATVDWTAGGALSNQGMVINTGNMNFNPGPLVGDVMNCGTINSPATFNVTGPAPDGTPCDAGLVVGCDCIAGVIAAPAAQAVPTMSQWGLILLALLSLSFIMIAVVAQQRSLAGAEGNFSLNSMSKGAPFEKGIFEKALLFVGVLALIAGAMTLSVYGSIAAIDFIGTAVCGPLLAYILHLMVLTNKK